MSVIKQLTRTAYHVGAAIFWLAFAIEAADVILLGNRYEYRLYGEDRLAAVVLWLLITFLPAAIHVLVKHIPDIQLAIKRRRST